MVAEALYTTPDEVTIAYEVRGDGRPFGYAHGILLSRAAVRELGLFDIDAIAADRRLLAYDQRGHGRSTGRSKPADYRFEQAADDLLDLLDAAGIDEPIDFAGSSLGAAAALYAALTAPHRFRRLALLIPPVAWESGPHQLRQWYFDTADLIDDIGAAAWRRQWADAPSLPIFAEYPQGKFTPDVDDVVVSSALRGAGLSDLPEPAKLASLPHPTLILAWDTDALHPVSTAQRLAQLIPNSTLHIARTVDDVKTWTQRTADFFSG
ncbi:alpha/beta fold hydrolase [Mycolicibacterium gadium]|jgi:pimeloyl-ACP methyl ester carboxylesterase|uniref:Hydrolase n=1 Tax=Mycolicibacterium gadium TaxID=1794 RepID=A0A7I7WGI5_MYCGU|nr:alpha/beta hydrolase [Mycolicibacterium gadium]BBZ15992.1 hydrolase [Mycolicibacterium gadium]